MVYGPRTPFNPRRGAHKLHAPQQNPIYNRGSYLVQQDHSHLASKGPKGEDEKRLDTLPSPTILNSVLSDSSLPHPRPVPHGPKLAPRVPALLPLPPFALAHLSSNQIFLRSAPQTLMSRLGRFTMVPNPARTDGGGWALHSNGKCISILISSTRLDPPLSILTFDLFKFLPSKY